MGDFLKEAYGFQRINDVLDDRYETLCDKYHALELSHNRKKKALQKLDYILCNVYRWDPEQAEVVAQISKIIDDALYSDGRVYQKRFHKEKGVKNG